MRQELSAKQANKLAILNIKNLSIMTTQIKYEWCYETLDENGDIIDNDFADKLSEYNENRKTDTLCLVRNEGDEINGLVDRFWAYVKGGKLPECFEDGAGHITNIRVPKKFHNELKQNTKPFDENSSKQDQIGGAK